MLVNFLAKSSAFMAPYSHYVTVLTKMASVQKES